MKLILDNRERDLIKICELIKDSTSTYVYMSEILVQTLPIGDILLRTDEDKDVLLIERKSIQDLLASIKDGRYEEQSYRLTHSSGFPKHNIVYIIEGPIFNLKSAEKKLVFSCIASLNYFKGFSVLRTSSVQETAELIMGMGDKIDRNLAKGLLPSYLCLDNNLPVETNNTITGADAVCALVLPQNTVLLRESAIESYSTVVKKVKKENITKENIGEIVLCQIPGISTKSASAILAKFGTFYNLLKEIEKDPTCMKDIAYESAPGKMRKINTSCGESIIKFFT